DGFFARVNDPQATCPAGAIVECPGATDPPATGEPSTSGFCSLPACTFTDRETRGCGGTRTIDRTWTCADATDAASCTQTITVVDTTPPLVVAALEPLAGPRPPRAPRSGCSAASDSGDFRVSCMAGDACGGATASARLFVTSLDVVVAGSCLERTDVV